MLTIFSCKPCNAPVSCQEWMDPPECHEAGLGAHRRGLVADHVCNGETNRLPLGRQELAAPHYLIHPSTPPLLGRPAVGILLHSRGCISQAYPAHRCEYSALANHFGAAGAAGGGGARGKSRGRGRRDKAGSCLLWLSYIRQHLFMMCGMGRTGWEGDNGVWSSLQDPTLWPMHISGEGTRVRGGC